MKCFEHNMRSVPVENQLVFLIISVEEFGVIDLPTQKRPVSFALLEGVLSTNMTKWHDLHGIN